MVNKKNTASQKSNRVSRVQDLNREKSTSRSPSHHRSSSRAPATGKGTSTPLPNQIATATASTATATADTAAENNQEVNDDVEMNISNEDTGDEADALTNKNKRKSSAPAIDHLFVLNLTSAKYKCSLCPIQSKELAGPHQNLRKHLWHGHEKSEYLLESQRKSLHKPSNPIRLSSQRTKELDKAAIDCIIEDSRTFGDFNKTGMLKFLSVAVPGYDPPNEKTVVRHLTQNYIAYRRDLKLVLTKASDIALTTDMWKNKNGSYFMCLTGHFYDEDFNISFHAN